MTYRKLEPNQLDALHVPKEFYTGKLIGIAKNGNVTITDDPEKKIWLVAQNILEELMLNDDEWRRYQEMMYVPK
jgi:hypothetical protein